MPGLDWLPTFVNIAGGPKGDGLSLIHPGARFMVFIARTDCVRREVGRALEVASAIAIVAFGARLLSTR